MSEDHPQQKQTKSDGGVNIGSISGVTGGEINIAGRDIRKNNVNTGGGTYIGGDVNTDGGDFVGGNKMTTKTNDSATEQVTIEQLLELLEKIKAAVPGAGLNPDEEEEVLDNQNKASSQAQKSKPDPRIIVNQINTVAKLLFKSTSTTAPQLIEWCQLAATWAAKLFD